MAVVGSSTPTSEHSPRFVTSLVLTVLGTSCNSLSLYYLSSFILLQLFKHV